MIIGNEKQKQILKDLLENMNQGTILVFGPEGVGKFSFLKEILKDKKETIFINSEEKILKIDTARMITSLGLQKSTKRIVVINDAHKFQNQSQNTLLKTLEEPFSKTIFVLITHRFYKILPTIRSRSILIRFGLVSFEETVKILKEKGYRAKEIELALNFYPGQPGKALKFLENKNKREVFQKFILANQEDKVLLIDELKNNFSLSEFLENYILFLRKKIFDSPLVLFQIKNILNLYHESLNYNLNFDIQIANLILNNG